MSAGSGEFEIGATGRGEDFLHFSDAGEAEEFLRTHLGPDELRAAMAEEGAGPEMKHLDDHQILQAVARRIARGEIHVYPRAAAAPAFAVEEEEKKAAPAANGEKSWIAFRFVHDTTGEPIANVQLRVTLPDGTIKEGKNDSDGRLEFTDVGMGTVSITSPIAPGAWEKAYLFVEGGEKPVDSQRKAEADGVQTNDSVFIVTAETHRLDDGETLEQVARTHGCSQDDLSIFTWGTTDPDAIERIQEFEQRRKEQADLPATGPAPSTTATDLTLGQWLRLQDTGTGETPLPVIEEGANEEAEPRVEPLPRPIVAIPKPWSRSDLETGRTHTVRVRPRFELRVRLDGDASEDRFRLFSSDGSHEATRILEEGGPPDLFFAIHPTRKYSLEVRPKSEEAPYFLFQDLTYGEMFRCVFGETQEEDDSVVVAEDPYEGEPDLS